MFAKLTAGLLAGAWIVAWRHTDAAHYHAVAPAPAAGVEPLPPEQTLQG